MSMEEGVKAYLVDARSTAPWRWKENKENEMLVLWELLELVKMEMDLLLALPPLKIAATTLNSKMVLAPFQIRVYVFIYVGFNDG